MRRCITSVFIGVIVVEMYHYLFAANWKCAAWGAYFGMDERSNVGTKDTKKSIMQWILLPSSPGLSSVAKLSSLFVQQAVQRNVQVQQLSDRDGIPSSRWKQRLPMNDGLLSGCERLRLTVQDEQRVVMPSISGW